MMPTVDPQAPAASLVAGLDVGTHATKCLVCDRQGRVVAQSSSEYGLHYPCPGWVEQDAEDLWRAVVGALRGATAQIRGEGQIVSLSLSSQGGTTIPVDGHLRPLRPAISWLDTRAQAEGERTASALGQDVIYHITGWEASAYLPLLHIPWLRAHEPQTYNKAGRYLFVNDFILARLTGRLCMDPSDAALTMLFNIERGTWDERLCREAGVQPEQLSPIIESGRPVGPLQPEAAEATGLAPDCVVVNGGHDQYCAALGAGVVRAGDLLLSCGTAWVLLAVSDRLLRDPRHTFGPGRHVVPGRWGLLASLPAAGATMDWLARNVLTGPGEREPSYHLLDETLGDPEPGANGLLFLPYLAGIEAATRSQGVWGTLTGLTLAHTRWDVAQALMEGVALELRWVLERLEGLGYRPALLHMVGGATHSLAWPQIVADATGVPVALSDVPEAGARGAALLAALGAGWYASAAEALAVWQGQEHVHAPRAERAAVYTDLFARFKSMDRALRLAR